MPVDCKSYYGDYLCLIYIRHNRCNNSAAVINQRPYIATLPFESVATPLLPLLLPFWLPSCSIWKSLVRPEGLQMVPSAHSIITLHWPAAHRCHESVMQFHWPSTEHDVPAVSARRYKDRPRMTALAVGLVLECANDKSTSAENKTKHSIRCDMMEENVDAKDCDIFQ
jgi:hypothetical protein